MDNDDLTIRKEKLQQVIRAERSVDSFVTNMETATSDRKELVRILHQLIQDERNQRSDLRQYDLMRDQYRLIKAQIEQQPAAQQPAV